MTMQQKEGFNTAEEDEALKEYTMEEVRKHNTEDDLWVVIFDRVYNVTEFQIDHPGGPDVLLDIGGLDGTEEFENILHTMKARRMAKKYLIGKLKGKVPGNLFASEEESDTGATSSNQIEPTAMNTYVTIGILAVAATMAYKFYLADRFSR